MLGFTLKMEDDKVEVKDNDLIAIPAIVTKYQTAGSIARNALTVVSLEVKAGANVKSLCALGDAEIVRLTGLLFKKTPNKGIAFPTTVSVNTVMCHFSPLEDTLVLKEGDSVKIELGVHIDGYIAQTGSTFVVGPKSEVQLNLEKAVNTLARLSLRLVQIGKNSTDFTTNIKKVAEEFKVTLVEGIVSTQILRNVLDGPNKLHQNPTGKVESHVFELGQVYSISMIVSTGEGKSKPSSDKTTIYKRNPNATYQLKMKSARQVFSTISKDYGMMAFNINHVEKGRMGIIECVSHGLVDACEVLEEKGELAMVTMTVILLKTGPLIITENQFEAIEEVVKDEEILKLLKEEYRITKKK